VVKGVSLRLNRGEVVGLLGPNGAGKTTCFYMITGLIAADYGAIWLDGEDILSPALVAEMARERIRGQDLVLPFKMSWGAGVMRNETVTPWGPGLATFGHSGWGGSCAIGTTSTAQPKLCQEYPPRAFVTTAPGAEIASMTFPAVAPVTATIGVNGITWPREAPRMTGGYAGATGASQST
jgi:energy-coupling factor transporter ATP-binding protein EcfA2